MIHKNDATLLLPTDRSLAAGFKKFIFTFCRMHFLFIRYIFFHTWPLPKNNDLALLLYCDRPAHNVWVHFGQHFYSSLIHLLHHFSRHRLL